jgi:hypothetical protein
VKAVVGVVVGATCTVVGVGFGAGGGGTLPTGGVVTGVAAGGAVTDGNVLLVGVGAIDGCVPGPVGGTVVVTGVVTPLTAVLLVVVVGFGFFFGPSGPFGFGGADRGGAVAAGVPPTPVVAAALVVEAPDAVAVPPIEAMIERNAEKLSPATRMRVAAAGWRRRRRGTTARSDSGPVVGVRRLASRASRSSRSARDARSCAPSRIWSIVLPPMQQSALANGLALTIGTLRGRPQARRRNCRESDAEASGETADDDDRRQLVVLPEGVVE